MRVMSLQDSVVSMRFASTLMVFHTCMVCALQDMDWQQLIKSSKAHLEFLQWLHNRYSWQEPMPGYQPSEHRKLAKGGLVSDIPTPSSKARSVTPAAGMFPPPSGMGL